MTPLEKYFPELLADTTINNQFAALGNLYRSWNERINVISRKDIESLYERHVIHSLALSRHYQFPAEAKILDIGTGGGFPGIPLAIAFPWCNFYLIDSIGKKIQVVQAIAEELGLNNVKSAKMRAEQFEEPMDYIVSRAVAPMEELVKWSSKTLKVEGKGGLPGKYFLLKGGNLNEEIQSFKLAFPSYYVKETAISSYFDEDFFETKKIVELARIAKSR